MAAPRQVPSNRTTAAERRQSQLDVERAGAVHDPLDVTVLKPNKDGQGGGRTIWITLLLGFSGAVSNARLVALVLVRHGELDGTRIYPGIRRLAALSGLSQPTVANRLDDLIRQGWLQREPFRGRSTRNGTLYWLSIPRRVIEALPAEYEHRTRLLALIGTEEPSAQYAEDSSAPTVNKSRGAATGAENGNNSVLKNSLSGAEDSSIGAEGSSAHLSESHITNSERGASPDGAAGRRLAEGQPRPEDMEGKIRTLLNQRFEPDAIAKILSQDKVTTAMVEEVRRGRPMSAVHMPDITPTFGALRPSKTAISM